VIAAASAASASAHAFFVEKIEVKGTEKFKFQGTSEISELESEVVAVKMGVACGRSIIKGELEKAGLARGEVTLESCRIFETKEGRSVFLGNCSIAGNINFKIEAKLISGAGRGVELEVLPNAGKLFVEFEVIGGLCTLNGKYKVETATEGKGQICWPYASEEGRERHLLYCIPTGSGELRLKVGAGEKKAGLFFIPNVSIENGKKWYGM
jgi:hypothetical protein